MTTAEAHTLAQTDPVPTLMARHGDAIANTRAKVADLEQALRELDSVTDMLEDNGVSVLADLGIVGDAARRARTAALADAERPGYELPRAAA